MTEKSEQGWSLLTVCTHSLFQRINNQDTQDKDQSLNPLLDDRFSICMPICTIKFWEVSEIWGWTECFINSVQSCQINNQFYSKFTILLYHMSIRMDYGFEWDGISWWVTGMKLNWLTFSTSTQWVTIINHRDKSINPLCIDILYECLSILVS